MPNRALVRARWAICALRTRVFVGSQPTLRQVPPIFQRSTITTLAPSAFNSKAAVLPAPPAPITTTSKVEGLSTVTRFSQVFQANPHDLGVYLSFGSKRGTK